ncbi:unnamed protein product [Ixodes pacificus]
MVEGRALWAGPRERKLATFGAGRGRQRGKPNGDGQREPHAHAAKAPQKSTSPCWRIGVHKRRPAVFTLPVTTVPSSKKVASVPQTHFGMKCGTATKGSAKSEIKKSCTLITHNMQGKKYIYSSLSRLHGFKESNEGFLLKFTLIQTEY